MTNETRYDHRAVDDLLRAAKEHFLKSGYEKASLRKICASAGVTTGALYFSFANKEALFDALVGPTLHKLDAILDDVEVKTPSSMRSSGKSWSRAGRTLTPMRSTTSSSSSSSTTRTASAS